MSDRYDSQEFHELMMDYRGSMDRPAEAYARVLEFIRAESPQVLEPLPDKKIDEIVGGLDGGVLGYLKTWGYVTLARAIEEAHNIPAKEQL
jgi:hypothetical protein